MSDRTKAILDLHARVLNPGWADILTAVGLPVDGFRAQGSWLRRADGAGLLDMIAGFGAAVLGHNPPRLIRALHDALELGTPMVAPLGVIPEAGELAARLIALAGGRLTKVQFGSTGAEAVDTALKLAAAHTGRRRFLRVHRGFHGLSVGATSLAGSDWWRSPFPDSWVRAGEIAAGDLDGLEAELRNREIAALVLEVVPGSDAGNGWSRDALEHGSELCRHYGTLLVVDEVQTGLGRTGGWFAFQAGGTGFQPDVVLVSKALTGGIVPLSAILMSEEVFASTYGQPSHAKIHGSTFAGNRLAMACGLAVLDIIEEDALVERAHRTGERIIRGLSQAAAASFVPVHGRGCLLAIEVGPDPQVANARCVELIRSGILVTGVPHAPRFIRATPPLNLSDEDADLFVESVAAVLT